MAVLQIDTSELQKRLPSYLKQVESGEIIQISANGRVFARLSPAINDAEAAKKRLDALRGSVIIGDVVSSADDEWSGDENHL